MALIDDAREAIVKVRQNIWEQLDEAGYSTEEMNTIYDQKNQALKDGLAILVNKWKAAESVDEVRRLRGEFETFLNDIANVIVPAEKSAFMKRATEDIDLWAAAEYGSAEAEGAKELKQRKLVQIRDIVNELETVGQLTALRESYGETKLTGAAMTPIVQEEKMLDAALDIWAEEEFQRMKKGATYYSPLTIAGEPVLDEEGNQQYETLSVIPDTAIKSQINAEIISKKARIMNKLERAWTEGDRDDIYEAEGLRRQYLRLTTTKEVTPEEMLKLQQARVPTPVPLPAEKSSYEQIKSAALAGLKKLYRPIKESAEIETAKKAAETAVEPLPTYKPIAGKDWIAEILKATKPTTAEEDMERIFATQSPEDIEEAMRTNPKLAPYLGAWERKFWQKFGRAPKY